MSEMAERVGKAFFAQFQKYGGLTTWENLSDDARRIWMTELIPSVIGAMREPTEAMITAARITDLWDMSVPDAAPSTEHIEGTRDELGNAWRAMIDEALK